MENNEPMNMKERLLGEIRSQRLSMRPRLYFTLHLAALVATAVLAFAITVFLFNFIFFSVRLNAHDTLLGFGAPGLQLFLGLFPWWLFALDVALIAALESLSRRFRFGWKVPGLYLLAGIFFITASVGYAMERERDRKSVV